MSDDASLDLAAAILPLDPDRSLFGVDGWYVWCATPIVDAGGGGYYLFYARWPHGQVGRDAASDGALFDGFNGWMKHSEIAVAHAESPEGPYRHLRTIVSGTGDPARWDAFSAHNAHVRRFGDRYYLYFIATNPRNTPELWFSRQPTRWLQHHAGQRVGVVVADSLDDLVAGRGRRSDQPLVGPDYEHTFQMAVNPSITQMPSGEYLLAYKAWNADQTYITVMATGPTPEGPFAYRSTALDGALQAEDPYLWYDAARDSYFAIVKDFYEDASRDGALTSQFGALGLVESSDGFDWRPAQHPLVSLRELHTTDGASVPLERLERPQLLFDDEGQPIVLRAAISVGDPEEGTVNVAMPLRVDDDV